MSAYFATDPLSSLTRLKHYNIISRMWESMDESFSS